MIQPHSERTTLALAPVCHDVTQGCAALRQADVLQRRELIGTSYDQNRSTDQAGILCQFRYALSNHRWYCADRVGQQSQTAPDEQVPQHKKPGWQIDLVA